MRELKERAARERLEELTERSAQIFDDEEEQSIDTGCCRKRYIKSLVYVA